MPRTPNLPSPTWRSFLHNKVLGIAAIDMFILPFATFRLLFVMLILAQDRRKIVRFGVTQRLTAGCCLLLRRSGRRWASAAS